MNFDFGIKDKVALVTGASRGIGKAIAQTLGEQGAVIIGTATTRTGAKKITEAFNVAGIQGKGYELDVSQPASIEDLIAAVQTDFGAPTILVNNAGITRDNLMLRMKESEWLEVININLNSIYYMTKTCLKGMLKARWGRVISLTSVVAGCGNPGQANYAAAKAGIIGFSKSLALELATRNITVNTIAPGFIETEMTEAINEDHKQMLLQRIPMQRMGQVNEIADLVLFLASNSASYITGETLQVNGGMYMN